SGLNKNTIDKWLYGTTTDYNINTHTVNPTINNLISLCNTLNISLDYLFDENLDEGNPDNYSPITHKRIHDVLGISNKSIAYIESLNNRGIYSEDNAFLHKKFKDKTLCDALNLLIEKYPDLLNTLLLDLIIVEKKVNDAKNPKAKEKIVYNYSTHIGRSFRDAIENKKIEKEVSPDNLKNNDFTMKCLSLALDRQIDLITSELEDTDSLENT
ncbi:MAG: hypothetical protein K5921_11610, partial [Lachnospiraceae bacterium]|nr:hypothetical protein [Lachnospiraceae bacterium]